MLSTIEAIASMLGSTLLLKIVIFGELVYYFKQFIVLRSIKHLALYVKLLGSGMKDWHPCTAKQAKAATPVSGEALNMLAE